MTRICEVAAMIALSLALAPASAQIAASTGASSGADVPVTGPAAAPGQSGPARDVATPPPAKEAVADISPAGDVKRAVRKSRHDAAIAANSDAAIDGGKTAKASSKPVAPDNGH
ncbi:MAG: hypothetical protein JF564_06970 [Sphingomonas sp.]|jgi:hypothetical protein|nr:hypothetical protein [Sphingomonas sp.]